MRLPLCPHPGRLAPAALLLGASGCGLILDLGGSEPAIEDGAVGAATDGSADGGGPVDGGAVADGGGLVCADGTASDALALYRFEESLNDELGLGPSGIGAAAGWDVGPRGCGQAIVFPGMRDGTILFEHHDLWHRTVTIDLWLRLDALPRDGSLAGILSRDAFMTPEPGHLTLVADESGRLILRVQAGEETDGTQREVILCSRPVLLGEWTHVAMHVGPSPVQLFVDGVPVNEPGTLPRHFAGGSCGTGAGEAIGVDGNTRPWAVGATIWSSTETSIVVENPVAGAIDELRFSDFARTF